MWIKRSEWVYLKNRMEILENTRDMERDHRYRVERRLDALLIYLGLQARDLPALGERVVIAKKLDIGP